MSRLSNLCSVRLTTLFLYFTFYFPILLNDLHHGEEYLLRTHTCTHTQEKPKVWKVPLIYRRTQTIYNSILQSNNTFPKKFKRLIMSDTRSMPTSFISRFVKDRASKGVSEKYIHLSFVISNILRLWVNVLWITRITMLCSDIENDEDKWLIVAVVKTNILYNTTCLFDPCMLLSINCTPMDTAYTSVHGAPNMH